MRSQINRRLKQKTDDFDKVYREHKQTEADYKKLGSEFDRPQDKLKEKGGPDRTSKENGGASRRKDKGGGYGKIVGRNG